MKTNYRIAIAVFIAVTVFIFADALNNFSLSSSGGAPAGRTGSPGDGNLTCASSGCHLPGPTPAVMAGWITSTVPASGYVPGNTYTVTATATRPNHIRFGFEVSPQSITGTLLGTLIITNSVETQLVGANKYVTHKFAGTSGSGSKTWNFNWTAPVAGTGNVTFYGCFNVANNSGNALGDTIYRSTLVLSECTVLAQPGTITGPDTVCAGSAVNYSIASIPGAISYTWTYPSGWTGTSTTNSINLTAGTTSGNVTVTANNACGASPVRILAVTVNNVAVSIAPTHINCFGNNNGSATATPSGGSSPYIFAWSNAAASSTISNLSAGTYTVTVTDAVGCTKTASVTITEPPLLTACAPSQISICMTDSAALGCCSGSGGTPPYSYLWSPSFNLSSTVICNPVAFPLASIVYTVDITDANGCTATSTVTVIINPLPPTPVVSSSADTLYSNVTGPYIYQWYLNGNPVIGATADYHVTMTPGNYTVVITSTDGCVSSSSPYPFFPTGMENSNEGAISVYPNPANGHLFIRVTEQLKNNLVYIFDVAGHLVLKTEVTEGVNQIDISSIDKGIYMLSWQTDKGKFVQRFAVVR